MTDDFYRALEDKFRGSRELVKSRLRVYLPRVLPLARAQPELRVFDVGCGRGEWLELLAENRVAAYGMDLAADMLAACHERGLQASCGDAIAHLKTLPDRSLLVVSGFHVAEHLTFPDLHALLAEARRVLAPDGLLILETPNPENLVVGAASFYIDPTHQRPLPAQLLVFLAEHMGFARVEFLRLQEETRLDGGGRVGLHDVLAGVSPDYAIVARAASDPADAAARPDGMVATGGLSLLELAGRYDACLERRFDAQRQATETVQAQAAETQAQAAETQAQAVDAQAQAADARAQAADARAQAADARAQAADARAQAAAAAASARQMREQLVAVYTSRSWRLTRPLRWLVRQFRSRFPGS